MQNIFLSPHLDDICFSLAGTVLASRGGHLINVFTISEYVAQPLAFAKKTQERIDHVTALRNREDRQFAAACNLNRHDLQLGEPSLLGLGPFDLTDVRAEATTVGALLTDRVIELARAEAGTKPGLFCPMGIGGHRNHLSVLLAVLDALPRLRPHCQIFFYEDLHYASRRQARNVGLARFAGLLAEMRAAAVRRQIVLEPTSFEQKMRLVNLYASQHDGRQRAADYIPAAAEMDEPSPPHEACWALADSLA